MASNVERKWRSLINNVDPLSSKSTDNEGKSRHPLTTRHLILTETRRQSQESEAESRRHSDVPPHAAGREKDRLG